MLRSSAHRNLDGRASVRACQNIYEERPDAFSFLLPWLVPRAAQAVGSETASVTARGWRSGIPVEDQPESSGDDCRGLLEPSSAVYGWETACSISDSTLQIQDHLTQEIASIPRDPNQSAPWACCEGNPSGPTADSSCVASCMRERCSEAELLHEQLVAETGCAQAGSCDFPIADCVSGFAHVSYLTAFTDSYDPTIEYTVTASCSATSIEPRANVAGAGWAFLEDPNTTINDPNLCGAPAGHALEPSGLLGTHTGVDDSGMQAVRSWDFDGTPGADHADVVDAKIDYSLKPCGTGECVSLSSLSASVENMSIGGFSAQKARISVVGTGAEPSLKRGETFTFPAGSLQTVVDVQLPSGNITLFGANTAPVYGRRNPSGDVLQLSNLQFTYSDNLLAGTLAIDISARYSNRPPAAAIRLLSNPRICSQTTSFQAARSDLDQDTMTHVWWVPGQGVGSGPTFDVVLPRGAHPVVLVSSDAHGGRDIEVLIHRNNCL